MKIIDVEYFRLDMPLAMPYTIAYETISSATNIILKLITDKGTIGWGCAEPDLAVTKESPEEVIFNIENFIIPLLKGSSPFHIARINNELKQNLKNVSSTLAMVDMALFDLMSRHAKLPLYQLLGGFNDKIATSITIGILPLKETLDQARYYLNKEFFIIKLKGGKNVEDDIEKIIALRKVLGEKIVLRFDANQGYTVQEAFEFVKATHKANVEILEQPTARHKDQLMGQVTKNVSIPVMADESIQSLQDAFRLASNDLINMVNIKLQKVGGIQEANHINSVAKAAQMETMVGCLDECALGISASLHFSLSKPNIQYADLDGHLDLLEDPFENLFRIEKGFVYPTMDHGLGKINLDF